MDLVLGFVFATLLAFALLVGVLISGRARRRRLHLILVASAVVALGGAVFLAERLGGRYDLQSSGWITPVHLQLAHGTVVALLLQILSGAWVLRRPRFRRIHGRLAILVSAMVVLAGGTGAWMLLAAEKL